MFCRFSCALAALAFTVCADIAAAVPVLNSYAHDYDGQFVPVYPGDRFDWPAPFAAYFWDLDASGVTGVPTSVFDFTVINTTLAPITVKTFQAFGQCYQSQAPWQASFTLEIDGTSTEWSEIVTSHCLYHNLINYSLKPGETRFSLVLNSPTILEGQLIDVRFGNTGTAIPLPGAGLLAMTGLAALGGIRRARR